MRSKLAERHFEVSSLKVGHIAFRKGKPCRIVKVFEFSTARKFPIYILKTRIVIFIFSVFSFHISHSHLLLIFGTPEALRFLSLILLFKATLAPAWPNVPHLT